MKALIAAAALATPYLVVAAPLKPTQAWVVDFAEQQCVASRTFGTSANPLTMVLKPSPMGKVLQVTFIRESGGIMKQTDAEIQIGSNAPINTSALAFTSPSTKRRLVRINLPDENSAKFAEAREVSVKVKGELSETLALTQMPAVMKAMGECLTDLKDHWNVGPENETRFKERAKGNLAAFFNFDDYPALAVDRDQAGTVQFAALINEAGKVADCTVIETSNVPILDAQVCAVMFDRAKLAPAMGADGKPTRDALTGRVRWVLP